MTIFSQKFLALILVVLVTAAALIASRGAFGTRQDGGEIAGVPRDPDRVREKTLRQLSAREPLGAIPGGKQILFGDLHVHTTFSFDAYSISLPMYQGEGSHPPADACDFARFCSDLDFWSINDHAEGLTPHQWRETRETVRQCTAVAGNADDPDLVTFLGWEWTQIGNTKESHYGHKNVILLDTEESRVPIRPIGAGSGDLFNLPIPSLVWTAARAALALGDLPDPGRALEVIEEEQCTFMAGATPFLLDLVYHPALRNHGSLSSMRLFLCGGASIPEKLMRDARSALPHTYTSPLWA